MKHSWLWLAVALCLSPVQQPDPFAAAVAAYRAERYDEALQGFRALADPVAEAPAELLGNLALAALRQRRPAEAEAAANVLRDRGPADERALGTFLLGQASFERALLAELAAGLPDAEPGIWQSAVDRAEAALEYWLEASRLRGGWPEAVRNAERAARRLQQFRAARDAAETNSRSEPAPEQPSPPQSDGEQEERVADLDVRPLTAAELSALRQRLQQKEREKRALRRVTMRIEKIGERDW